MTTCFEAAMMPDAEMCRNLRMDDGGRLVPAGLPPVVGEAGVEPLLTHYRAAGPAVTVARRAGRELWVDGEAVAATDSEIYAAVSDGDDRIAVLTAAGVRTLVCEKSGWRLRGLRPPAPLVSVVAAGSVSLRADIGAMTLSGDYLRTGVALTDADRDMLTEVLADVYSRLYDAAAGAGVLLQPRLMAWRLLDRRGRVVDRSVPFWAPAMAFRGVDMLQLPVAKSGDAFREIAATSMGMTGVKLGVKVAALPGGEEWRDEFSRLEVLAMPQLHPVDFSRKADARLSAAGQASAVLVARFPGAVSAAAGLARLTDEALERFEQEAEVVAVVDDPFASPGEVYPLPGTPSGESAADALARQKAMMRRRVMPLSADGRLLVSLLPPNRLTARTVSQAGHCGLLADVESLPFKGRDAMFYALATVRERGRVSALITMGDGSVRSVTDVNADEVPTQFAPVIVCHEPSAVAITLRVQRASGSISSVTLPLSPSRNGLWSRYVAPEMMPVVPAVAEATFPIPVDGAPSAVRHGGVIAVAPAASVFSPVAARRISGGRIVRLTAPPGVSSGWNYARTHLLAWASDAVYAVSVSGDGLKIGASRIHSPGIVRADAVADVGSCLYAALADGALVRMTGSRMEPVALPRRGKAVAAGADMAHGELWVLDAAGEVSVRPVAGGAQTGWWLRDVGGTVRGFYAGGGRLEVVSSVGLLDASDETDGPVPVEWTRTARRSPGASADARWFMADMQSPKASIDVSLAGDRGAGAAQRVTVTSLAVDGAVDMPLGVRIAGLPRGRLTVRISGKLAVNSSIERAAVW